MTETNYTTLSDLKSYLGIDDVLSDGVLTASIVSASRSIDSFCGRRFYVDDAVSARTYWPTDRCTVAVDDFSTTTGLIVATDEDDDGTYELTWDSNDYDPYPANREVAGITGLPYWEIVAVDSRTFPVTGKRRPVQVTAKWGWAAVPDPVKRACEIKAARLFRRSQTPEGFAAGEAFGAIRISSREDPDAVMLLSPYRKGGGKGLVVA